MSSYQEPAREKHLATITWLQLGANQNAEALSNLKELRELRAKTDPSAAALWSIAFELFAAAKARARAVDDSFKQAFRDHFSALDAVTALQLEYWLYADVNTSKKRFEDSLDAQKSKSSLTSDDAIALIRNYQFYVILRSIQPLVEGLVI